MSSPVPMRRLEVGRSVLVLAVALASGAASADVLTLVSTNEEAGGFFGAAVSGIPDVDGDGFDDVIVGAPEENGGGVNDAGRVYIYSGRTGDLIRAHSSPNDSIEGDYGISVAGIPDVTGDGRGDYLVGASGELSFGGRVYLYSGASGALVRLHQSVNIENQGFFGRSVAAIGDLNNDGRGDYIVGAPGENSERGRAYVYSGQTGALLRTHNSPNAEIGGQFGFAVAGVPDADFDGRDDYAIGAPNEDPGGSPTNSGRAYIYSGINGSLEHTLASSNPSTNGRFGYSIAGAPDVGGNGGGDVIVGAPNEPVQVGNDLLSDAGRAYLFSGTGGFVAAVYEAPDADAHTANQFGWAVAGIPDRTGDGLGELVVGAPGWPGYDVYVFEGTNGFGLVESVGSPDGLGANQLWGGAIASVGDANGDGRGDYIVGGRGSDNAPSGPSESGRAYVYRSPIVNDACTALTLLPLVDGDNPFTIVGATGAAVVPCGPIVNNDVWFEYTAICDGPITFSTCGGVDFNTLIALYDGCSFSMVAPFACQLGGILACSNDAPGCGTASRVTVEATAGQCFIVRVGSIGPTTEGAGVLTVTCGCAGDLDGDGQVGASDLAILLGAWGTSNALADLDDDGAVDAADLALLLGAWGPC